MKNVFINKFKTSIVIVAISLFCLGIIACSSDKIAIESFDSYLEPKNNEVCIKWNFPGAEFVTIDGKEHQYNPNDSINMQVFESTKYKINAIIPELDSLSMYSYIYIPVDKPENEQGIRRGPNVLEQIKLSNNTKASKYFTGLVKSDTNYPRLLKIIRTVPFEESDNSYSLYSLVLDENGNFISGLADNTNVNFKASHYCHDDTLNQVIKSFEEINNLSSKENLDVCFLLDNSSSAFNQERVLESISEFFPALNPDDNFMFYVYNQDFIKLIQYSYADKAFIDLKSTKLPNNSGLNSVYKTVYQAINSFPTSSKNKKLLILLTFNQDNSSIIYNANDVADISKEMEVPIYIVGLGDAFNSYSLRYLANLTNGSYYHLFSDEFNELSKILQEIIFGQKLCYKNVIPVNYPYRDCEILKTILFYNDGLNELNAKSSTVLKQQIQYSQFQTIATFNYGEDKIANEFNSVIESLANVLMDNPSAAIELIGHCSFEGSNEIDKSLSLSRAEETKKMLMQYGASPNQIKIRGVASSQPLYYLQLTDWQQRYNRRVEVRWLYPSMLPFEIIAEKTETEDEAIKKVEQWEKRKFKAYYDRIVENNKLFYRTKIWGYKTQKEAEQAVAKLKKKYNDSFVVE